MATIFRSRRRFRVVVYSNDHPPPHVHAIGPDGDARFLLNCPDGPVALWDYEGAGPSPLCGSSARRSPGA
ncbi:MAG: DUF4160 domain-containing protein [Brevundimonas sp.]|uniref:DUF4160 domain-containing protein n=1 Tax=Brevundimonas sp. TaxID=1871086 RepID=UPI00391A3DAA